ncbi:ABC transporter substrate-binding protein [Macrococcus equipercicus]|uniref:ABC transporter substrate-binding protein n=2 Tax=Macrococcus equipercicus TaxID=69967 RepID=A0A9Q9BV20_9STAP|nr:ABC transporter substrate-binding protein [Macrococcus equipercicus]
MKKKEVVMKKLLLIILLVLTGCQHAAAPTTEKSMRIISLMPSNTEILYRLGLGRNIIGVSTVDDYPKDVATKQQFDSFNLNKEALLKAQPTLIVAHESAKAAEEKILSALQQKGIKVIYVKDATSLTEIDDTFMQIAKATDRVKEGRQLSAEVNKEIKEVSRKYPAAAGSRVFMEVSGEPEIYTGGRGTLFDDMLTTLHATNVFHDIEGWQPVSKEAIVRKNPDILITTSGQQEADYRKTVDGRGGFRQVTAVKKSRVYALNDDLLSRPGPRIAKGLEALAAVLADK